MPFPSAQWRSPDTECWQEAVYRSTVFCQTTLGCFSALPVIWQEKSRQTPTWLLLVCNPPWNFFQSYLHMCRLILHIFPPSSLPLFSSQIRFSALVSNPLFSSVSCLPHQTICVSLCSDRFVTLDASAIIDDLWIRECLQGRHRDGGALSESQSRFSEWDPTAAPFVKSIKPSANCLLY